MNTFDEERLEAVEHRDVILNIRAVLKTDSGRNFVKYLFKNLEVTGVPPMGMEGCLLSDKLGFLRAGNSIFKIICEANFEIAGKLVAQNEREEYERTNRPDPGDNSEAYNRLYD